MRRILRTARTAIVLTIVFMMTVDTANACRLFQRLFAQRAECCTSYSQSHEVQHSECPSSFPAMSDHVVEYPVVSDVVYGGIVSGDCCSVDAPSYPVEGGYVVEEEATIFSYPDEGGEVYSGEVVTEDSHDASPVDAIPMDSVIGITPADEVPPAPDNLINVDEPIPAEAAAPTEVEAPANPLDAPAEEGDSLFEAPPTPEEDLTDGADDLFGGDDAAAPAADGADDLFGGDDAAAPAADGADDLFNGDDAAAPAADGADDLFNGDDAAAPAADGADDLFGGDDAAAPAADGADDLFGGDDAAAPAADGADDLFGGDDAAAPAADGADDLFEGGDAAPADGGDDLFEGGTAPGDGADGDDLNDLFGRNQRPNGMRVWTDDTGTYKTVGRLVLIAKTHVRLLKDSGRFSTVPLQRLSNRDLDYVMVIAQKLAGSQRIASR